MTHEHPTHTPAQIDAALAEFDGTGWVDEDAFPGNTAALREVLTRALAAADAAAWQPMETAPRDGTEIEVLECGEWQPTMWSERPVCMLGSLYYWPPGWVTSPSCNTDNNLPLDIKPTHWRPI